MHSFSVVPMHLKQVPSHEMIALIYATDNETVLQIARLITYDEDAVVEPKYIPVPLLVILKNVDVYLRQCSYEIIVVKSIYPVQK